MLRRRTERRVQGNKVALRQQLVKRHKFDRYFMRRRFADEWVVSQHAHIKRLRAHGHFAPDSSEAHKPERFPAHFGSRCGGFFPAPLVDSSVQPSCSFNSFTPRSLILSATMTFIPPLQ